MQNQKNDHMLLTWSMSWKSAKCCLKHAKIDTWVSALYVKRYWSTLSFFTFNFTRSQLHIKSVTNLQQSRISKLSLTKKCLNPISTHCSMLWESCLSVFNIMFCLISLEGDWVICFSFFSSYLSVFLILLEDNLPCWWSYMRTMQHLYGSSG